MPDWILQNELLFGVLFLAILLGFLYWFLQAKREPSVSEKLPFESIAISQLFERGPDESQPYLMHLGTPVQIAEIVLAPSGRHTKLPEREGILVILDALLPDFSRMVERDAPLIRRWPAQLSVRGFAQAFFNRLELPGKRGKGTPWSALAGRVEVEDASYLVGLVFCANRSNSLSTSEIELSSGWTDVLRIHSS